MSPLENSGGGESPRKFTLDRQNNMLAGVCSGIGRHFGLDPLLVRLVFVIGALLGFGSFILIYLAIWLLAK